MFRTLTPLFALVVAVALYFTYIQPTMEEIQLVEAETQDYQEAVEKAEQLRQRISELITARNNISQSNLERLEALLPDTIDEVEFLIALDTLARDNNLQISNIDVEGGEVKVEELLGFTSAAPRSRVPAAVNEGVVPFDMTFVVSGTYRDFRSFLSGLERSLQAIEITELTFGSPDDGDTSYDFQFGIRTFSLAPNN